MDQRHVPANVGRLEADAAVQKQLLKEDVRPVAKTPSVHTQFVAPDIRGEKLID
jgi:hypothetical protein